MLEATKILSATKIKDEAEPMSDGVILYLTFSRQLFFH